MILYSFSKDDTKTRMKNIVHYLIMIPIILGIISLVCGIFFTVISIVVDSEALNYSILFFAMTALFFIFCLMCYKTIKKAFKVCVDSPNEIFDFRLYMYNGLIMIDSISTQKTDAFSDRDIVKVYWKKSTIIVRVKGNRVVDFPKTPELIEF